MNNIKYNPFPLAFEIQTASYCNAKCMICPHREVSKNLPNGIMEMDLFKKIIDQIDNPWGVKIIPYFNNEPFLDSLFIDRLNYIAEKCPEAEIEISSNVSLLNAKMQKKLIGIDIRDLRLSVFGFTKESHHSVMPGLDWNIVEKNLWLLAENKELRQSIGQVSIVMIDYSGIKKEDIELAKSFCKKHFIKFELWGFFDRGKNVKDYSNDVYRDSVVGCEQRRQQERMHIIFDGRVVLCCMDWKLEYVLGNLNQQSIKEVWDSNEYQKIRKDIHDNNALELCKKCKLSY